MFGYTGKILRIDLSNKNIKISELSEKLAEKYIGARGLGSKILYDEIDPKVEPLSKENKLIFVTGPCTGTSAPTGSRYNVVTKSPLTGTIAASNSGGHWGAELKKAGFNLIIFEKISEKPVYILINNDEIEIKDASHLWGLNTHKTTDKIIEELGNENIKVACIGPAGEKLSRISCIINDKNRAAGRSGVGAVMGSKRLKAVAVKGDKEIKIAKPEEFKIVRKNSLKKINENAIVQDIGKYGTANILNLINTFGIFPTKNFQEGIFKNAWKIDAEAITNNLLVKRLYCFSCPIGCGRITKVGDKKGEGPEYETVWAFGAQCGIGDLKAITKANYLCNELGLDTISTGSTIGCAMELSEKGYISDKINFGDSNAIIEYTKMIGLREGLGDELAEGSYRFAEKYNHPELSMSAKKQEFPAYDPRGAQAQGLVFATSNRGACHVRGFTVADEITRKDSNASSTKGKAKLAMNAQDFSAFIDSIGLCRFTMRALSWEDYTNLVRTITGFDYTIEDMMKAGERIWNLERIFNIKAGLTKEDDTLPPRLLNETLKKGSAKGVVWKRDELIPEYYALRGWDSNGVPTKEKLKELGI